MYTNIEHVNKMRVTDDMVASMCLYVLNRRHNAPCPLLTKLVSFLRRIEHIGFGDVPTGQIVVSVLAICNKDQLRECLISVFSGQLDPQTDKVTLSITAEGDLLKVDDPSLSTTIAVDALIEGIKADLFEDISTLAAPTDANEVAHNVVVTILPKGVHVQTCSMLVKSTLLKHLVNRICSDRLAVPLVYMARDHNLLNVKTDKDVISQSANTLDITHFPINTTSITGQEFLKRIKTITDRENSD